MTSWDDGKHTSVRKVRIEYGSSGINSIKVDYNKNGSLFAAPKHGGVGAKNDEFTLSSNEYLIGINGYYTSTGSEDVITAITFESNIRSYGPYGHTTRSYFSYDITTGNQIVGFNGTSSNLLHDIYVYYGPIVSGGTDDNNDTDSKPSGDPQKLGAEGSNGGNAWDDGAYDNVKKIFVGINSVAIQYLKFEYEKGGQLIIGKDHGEKSTFPDPFEIILASDEYITSIEGTYENIFGYNDPIIVSLKFVTNLKKTEDAEPYGLESKNGTSFTLGDKVSKIIGFHGRSSDVLYKLGVYIKSSGGSSGQNLKPTPLSQKVDAQGGDGGTVWDDGSYDNVRKIHVGQGSDGIHYLKFEYEKSGQLVNGQEHGEKVQPPVEISLSPNEYLVSVEGTYELINGFVTPVIQSLRFKTNLKANQAYGFESGTAFSLEVNACKIIGFHGRSSKVVHKLGAYVKPISG